MVNLYHVNKVFLFKSIQIYRVRPQEESSLSLVPGEYHPRWMYEMHPKWKEASVIHGLSLFPPLLLSGAFPQPG